MAYGGYICEGCGRICGHVDSDGRCNDCGPLPKENKELTHLAAMERERGYARQIAARQRER
jgi:hypothetical protein